MAVLFHKLKLYNFINIHNRENCFCGVYISLFTRSCDFPKDVTREGFGFVLCSLHCACNKDISLVKSNFIVMHTRLENIGHCLQYMQFPGLQPSEIVQRLDDAVSFLAAG